MQAFYSCTPVFIPKPCISCIDYQRKFPFSVSIQQIISSAFRQSDPVVHMLSQVTEMLQIVDMREIGIESQVIDLTYHLRLPCRHSYLAGLEKCTAHFTGGLTPIDGCIPSKSSVK